MEIPEAPLEPGPGCCGWVRRRGEMPGTCGPRLQVFLLAPGHPWGLRPSHNGTAHAPQIVFTPNSTLKKFIKAGTMVWGCNQNCKACITVADSNPCRPNSCPTPANRCSGDGQVLGPHTTWENWKWAHRPSASPIHWGIKPADGRPLSLCLSNKSLKINKKEMQK